MIQGNGFCREISKAFSLSQHYEGLCASTAYYKPPAFQFLLLCFLWDKNPESNSLMFCSQTKAATMFSLVDFKSILMPLLWVCMFSSIHVILITLRKLRKTCLFFLRGSACPTKNSFIQKEPFSFCLFVCGGEALAPGMCSLSKARQSDTRSCTFLPTWDIPTRTVPSDSVWGQLSGNRNRRAQD